MSTERTSEADTVSHHMPVYEAAGEPPRQGPASQGPVSYDLPEKPLVVIEPSKFWSPINFRDLWAYRELLYFLMWRDVKVRYKQTLLGAAWAIIQPLVTMLVFTYFFGRLARVPTEGIPTPIFFYTGMLLWVFFSNAVASGANSLVGNTNLITKVYFPRLIIPAAAIGAGLLDMAIASVLLIGLLVYYEYAITWSHLLILPIVAITAMLALGFGVWLSAVNVRYRDVRYALPFVIQVWMFISPIIYPLSLVPEEWQWLLVLNPMTGAVEAFRAALLGRPIPWIEVGYSAVFSFILLLISFYQFRRMERSFAEYI